MAPTLSERVVERVKEAARAYHRLVLLVAPHGSGKTAALVDLELEHGWPLINVNLLLSERLLELTTRQRALRVARIVDDIVRETDADIVMLDNIEMLFHPDLKQNPLRLLQKVSRDRTIVATWRGTMAGDSLVYGSPAHPEHSRFEAVQALIVASQHDGPATNEVREHST